MKRPAPAPARSVVSSSPGRPEKLPAPGLGRLLRGKSGSRSRGRSSSAPRSSPMFISRSRSAGPTTGAAAAEGDPSSPKVSCIGQVRIRSKKKSGAGSASKLAGSKKTISMEYKQQTILPTLRCRCLTRLCRIWPESRPAGDSRSRWNLSRWFKRRSRSYRQRESGVAADNGFPPPVTAPRCSISDFDVEEVEESEKQEEETRVFMPSATSTPPKNALLLMRCRSAPHNRSSALSTSRFAITPVEPEPEPELELELELVEEQARIKCRDDAEVSCNQNSGDVKQEVDTPPVVLTRCKSEPARTAAAKLAVSEDDVISFCSSGSGRRLVEERRPAATAAPPASPSLKPI